MKKHFKRQLSLLMAVISIIVLCNAAPLAFGSDLVAINSTNFADATFRQIVDEHFNTNHDDYLSESERDCLEMDLSGLIDITHQTITNLKGIEFFSDLQILHCGGIGLKVLDVSALSNLVWLNCAGNDLTTLNFSANYNLEYLNCSVNFLTALRLPYSTTLTTLYCYANSLSTLSLDGVSSLRSLRCDQNELTQLSFTNNSKLTELNCSQNHLASIDLSLTAITTATDYEIGDQTIDVTAYLSGDEIIIPFENKGLTPSNYMGSTLDLYDDDSGFEYDRFVAYDVCEIKDGITYECYPMLDNAENMTVILNVSRNFYQVDFYTDESCTERIGKSIVNSGANATAPQISQTPQCKAFDCWSDEITNVCEDMDVYIVWADDHCYEAVSMAADKDTITVSCWDCGTSYQVSFISIVNSCRGDDLFDENIDVVRDGYINAKDYAVLLKTIG